MCKFLLMKVGRIMLPTGRKTVTYASSLRFHRFRIAISMKSQCDFDDIAMP